MANDGFDTMRRGTGGRKLKAQVGEINDERAPGLGIPRMVFAYSRSPTDGRLGVMVPQKCGV